MALHSSLVKSSTVECRFKTRSWQVGHLYTCFVDDRETFANSRMHIEAVEGEHGSQKSNDNVKAINIEEHYSMKFFPQNLENFFKKLMMIRIVGSGLEEITENDLKGFQQLKFLYLTDNSMKTLNEHVFRSNRLLERIWLNNNKISSIHPNTFNGLTRLSKLNLGNNDCKTALGHTNTRPEVFAVISRIKAGECSTDDSNEKPSGACEDEIGDMRAEIIDLKLQLSKEKMKVSLQSDYIQKLLAEIASQNCTGEN